MEHRTVEVSERADYGHVINRQLDRIVRVRSRMAHGIPIEHRALWVYSGAQLVEYFHSVYALYVVLLPELRGDAHRYLRAACDLEANLHRARAEGREAEVKEKYRRELGASDPLALVDRALEEIIVNLNEAGLLMRGRQVKVGSVRL